MSPWPFGDWCPMLKPYLAVHQPIDQGFIPGVYRHKYMSYKECILYVYIYIFIYVYIHILIHSGLITHPLGAAQADFLGPVDGLVSVYIQHHLDPKKMGGGQEEGCKVSFCS